MIWFRPFFFTPSFKRNNCFNLTNHNSALGGADVNETNTEGESLLQQSINQNNHEASSFLIVSGGADVNLRYFRSIIMYYFLDKTYSSWPKYIIWIFNRSNKGVTCIELAIQMKMCNVIELLCQFGADMSLSSNQYPPLWMALSQVCLKWK